MKPPREFVRSLGLTMTEYAADAVTAAIEARDAEHGDLLSTARSNRRAADAECAATMRDLAALRTERDRLREALESVLDGRCKDLFAARLAAMAALGASPAAARVGRCTCPFPRDLCPSCTHDCRACIAAHRLGASPATPTPSAPKCQCDKHDVACTKSADYLITRAGKRIAVCDRCTLPGDDTDDRDLNPDWSKWPATPTPVCAAYCGKEKPRGKLDFAWWEWDGRTFCSPECRRSAMRTPHADTCGLNEVAALYCTCGTLTKFDPSHPHTPVTGAADEHKYPCADCGLPRTKAEGGTTFTVCDACWDKHYGPRPPDAVPGTPDPYCELAASEIPGFGTNRDRHHCAKLHRDKPLPKPNPKETP